MIASGPLVDACPILRRAALQIADPQIRNLGTVGGNAANGDPGNDLPAVMLALDARYTLEGAGGRREVAAREYYEGAFATAREGRGDPHRDPLRDAAGRPRLRLRETEAQGRGLRHRRRGGDPGPLGRDLHPCPRSR